LPGLLLCLPAACSYFRAPIISKPAPELADFIRHQHRLAEISTLTAAATIQYESGFETINLTARIDYQAPDTLIALVRDPLSRKLARFKLAGLEYELHLLRKNEFYSGDRFPEQWLPAPLMFLTPPDLRRLLFGRLPEGINPAGLKPGARVPEWSHVSLPVRLILQRDLPVPAEIIFGHSPQPELRILFQEFTRLDDCFLPAQIIFINDRIPLRITIGFSQISAEMVKLVSK